ncbi:MAG: CTP synthase [Candidatus Paraimprobicoccus trichonymphae]|uniref:CTP synthase n=1 Tax=Candidatus Paraimprobicoccus trichonymphae TaxID=3033793 RepID=A0AA48KZ91_9FIRM|nr:MAG: CTP synthase [Candidatus Paraimprobicoccus trichonymphae]
MTKYIFVTGGVISGIGKGITVASLGRLLKSRGLKVTAQKLDPYINVDPGTMSPYQHGEVFVTEDGAETDLDLGHYERFMDEDLNKFSNLTTGKVYWNVLNKERNGEYHGETVQVIPHVTNEIKKFIYSLGEKTQANIVITEIGGTTGDIESQPFLEAIRQISLELGNENCLFIHVTYIPYIESSGEQKSKPTQHSVKELRSIGINPNIIVARSEKKIDKNIRKKISLFCNVKTDCVIENINLNSLYEAPTMFEKSNFSSIVCRELNLENFKNINMNEWNEMLEKIKSRNKTVEISIVGKYVKLHDAYLSIVEALNHAGFELGIYIKINWVDSELITENTVKEFLSSSKGILIPGGFGNRGIEGKINAVKFARENNIPYFGICLGMQIAVVEFARNILNLKDANSKEFSTDSKNLVINLMDDQQKVVLRGGTMRSGAYLCKIKTGSVLEKIYKKSEISERHRHRYEFNNKYKKKFETNRFIISGTSPDEVLVEAMELPENSFFVGVQYHPEFKSRPNKPHPLFVAFLKCAKNK